MAAVARVLRRMAAAEQPPWLHGEVARRMAERLAVVRMQPSTLIDWWGFNGASAQLLAQAYPQTRRLVVESLPALRERRAVSASRWSRWRRSKAVVLAPDDVVPGGAQLVWSNMMLHGALDPAALFARWHCALAVDGFLMFSCLGPGSLRELRDLYRRLDWPVPMADPVDMHDLGDMLVGAGFADPVMDQELLTLTWSTPKALLSELRALGGNVAPGRFAGLRTPRWRARLEEVLQSLAGADGRLSMTFEVAYGHAFKPWPRVKVQTETSVSLSDMRTLVKGRAPRG